MRARSAFLAGAGSAAIIAIGWQSGLGALAQNLPTSQAMASGTTGSASTSTATATPSATASASASTSASSAATSSSSSTTTYKDGTYTGSVIATRYGNSQVKVVISGGKITDVVVLQRQQVDQKSNQISSSAVVTLKTKVLAAQSAKVSNISGATYSTQGYLQSLQSALDQAK
jgi:uncharacterized protein with FMN-binding domain